MSDPISSYSTLVTAILDIAEDVGDELISYIPVAIDNAERRLTRELDIQKLVYTSTVTVTAGTPTFLKPAGHKVTHYLRYTDPNTGRTAVLRRKTDDYLDEYWPQATSAGTPVYYSEEDSAYFRIVPCASADSSVQIKGVRRPTALTSANPTNAFTSAVPDALFYASMIEIAMWQRNASLKQDYSEMYISTRDNLNLEAMRSRRDDGTPVGNPLGTNSISSNIKSGG